MAKRESYEGGGSKGKEEVDGSVLGSVLKLGIGGVGAWEWGVARWEQDIVMGQRVRVSHRIGRQGKYIFWDIFTMGASVGDYKAPHRRSICIIRKSGCGRGYLALSLPI